MFFNDPSLYNVAWAQKELPIQTPWQVPFQVPFQGIPWQQFQPWQQYQSWNVPKFLPQTYLPFHNFAQGFMPYAQTPMIPPTIISVQGSKLPVERAFIRIPRLVPHAASEPACVH